MQHRLAVLAGAIAMAYPVFAQAQSEDLYLLAAPLTSSEKYYSRVQKQIKADLVYSRGYYGQGATVAVLDTGVRGTHTELKTQLVSTTQMFDASTGTYVKPTDGHGHGTHVSGIVGGSTGTGKTYGIAPDAKLLAIKVFSSSTWTASASAIASGLKVATANPAVSIINLSLGGSSPLGSGVETQLRNTVAADKLVVAAAGNSGGSNPVWPARYAKETWANGQIIAVGAVDKYNKIASFSNRAGDTANWFIVAPGTSIYNASKGGDTSYVTMNGTSMAAPIVAGVAALIEGAWPHLKAKEVASILFQTATDLGATGIDAIYGWGLVNADKAMQPVGTLTVPTSSTTTTTVSGTTMTTSTASWSGLRAAAARGLFRGISLDSFNRDFGTDYGAAIQGPASERIADVMSQAGRSLQITERISENGSRFLTAVEEQRPTGFFANEPSTRTLLASSAVFKLAGGHEMAFATGSLAGRYFGLAETDSSLANPYLGLARSSAQMAMGFNHGPVSFKAGVLDGGLNAAMARQHFAADDTASGRAAVTELNYALGRDGVIGMQYADVAEGDAYLGTVGNAALALEQGNTRTVTAHAAYRVMPNLTLAAQYSTGRTADASGKGLFASARGVRSEAFAMGVVGRNAFVKDDRMALTVSSPLRIAAGTAELSMPVGLDVNGQTVFESRRVSLASTSRETKLGLDYSMPLSEVASLSWVAAMRHNANHVAGEREAQIGMIYRTAF